MLEELTNVMVMLVVGKVCIGLLNIFLDTQSPWIFKVIFRKSIFLCVGGCLLQITFFDDGAYLQE